MDSKLTLKLNREVIGKAKDYARAHNISLSRLIETYLELLTNKQQDGRPISKQVKKLSGIVTLPEDYDYRKDYRDHLEKKYK